MKIGDQKLSRTLKNQMVRRVLKDNKVPGTTAGTKEAEAPGPPPAGAWVCCQILGREPDWAV